jgi:hypothetical protein
MNRKFTQTDLFRVGFVLQALGMGLIYIGLSVGGRFSIPMFALALSLAVAGGVFQWRARRQADPELAARPREVERQLRRLLDEGRPLEDAVRRLQTTRGADLLTLWPGVAAVTGLGQREAMQLVVRATTPARA